MQYNKELLDITVLKYQAVLIGWVLTNEINVTNKNPEKLNRNAEIHYKCNCGNVYTKNFRMLLKHGAYCKSCQKEITAKKLSEINTKWTPETIRKAIDDLRIKLRHTCMEDWYKISQNDFKDNKLDGLLVGHYSSSPTQLLLSLYPEYNWNMILFKTKPQGFWDDSSNAKLALEHISKFKGWNNIHDLYKITRVDIEEQCSGLWDKFSSIIKILKYAYPTYDWQVTMLNRIPDETFDSIENHRQVINNLEEEFGIKTPMEWFDHLSYDTFVSRGYRNLLGKYYNHSASEFIFAMYPILRESIYKLKKVPQNCYDDINIIKIILRGIASDKGIISSEDWYNISCKDIKEYIGIGLEKWGGIIEFITKFVDVQEGFQWDKSKFINYKTEAKISQYLDKEGIEHTSQSKYEWLRTGVNNNCYYRFDEELTTLKIMLELDGPQHFTSVWRYGNPEDTMQNDLIKMKKSSENGYSGIRLYQPEVLNDIIDWKDWLYRAINYIKINSTPLWVFPNKDVYIKHIGLCIEHKIQYITLE